ncbi:acetyl-CoA carboxylase biotin carboxylase subunit [Pseudonocardia nigra]|uniref:acetyl-CoA carboxylase biotin carboxylase subunit n=1 Tax=Pseudonocardia nigra TaxID=1921578 RepID=UPI001C5E57B2|nr:biotin carboxylase N-terminal domain-containing protein [Pseudonocardia nigra]
MIESLLVANRGEIARRVIRTARALGVRTVALHAGVDADLPHVREADEVVALPGPAAYRDVEAVVAAARATGAEAVHPGYGFLSESPALARACGKEGLLWVGPDPESMELLADKVAARNHVAARGVPVLPGTADAVTGVDGALAAARRLGYPLMVKASAGGGGIGMGVAGNDDELGRAVATAASRGRGAFGDARVLLERYVSGARHVEVQVLGLPDGSVVAFPAERDCSVQRRHQKVVEETPSPAVDAPLRSRLRAAAVTAAQSVGYRNAGTVEFLLQPGTGEFFFLEVNTRLQVEHPITEEACGVDLVELQLRVAAGEDVHVEPVEVRGHAMEFRVCAEDPVRFLPGPGAVTEWAEPSGPGIRVDSGYAAGTTVTPHFDPLLAKLVVSGADRTQVLERARDALEAFRVRGPKINLPFLREVLADPEFTSGTYDTGIVDRLVASRRP